MPISNILIPRDGESPHWYQWPFLIPYAITRAVWRIVTTGRWGGNE